MKVFISASSGVGKSAVIDELSSRGLSAYDADDRTLNLTRLEIRESGEPTEWPKGYVDWHKYSWNANEQVLRELLASNETVFIAGFLGNQENLYHYFDKLIVLTIDRKEHERRLRSRPKRDFGDHEQNLQGRLEKYPMHLAKMVGSGFITVNNAGPVAQTVDEILHVALAV
jgi:dephospho-CoA kinase